MQVINGLSFRSLQYYVIARKWTSDLGFFDFECSFLHSLIADFVKRFNEDHALRSLMDMLNQLNRLDKDLKNTEQILYQQTRQLELMAEDIIPENSQALAGKQVELEYMMADITARFRRLKAELYNLLSSSMTDIKYVTD